MTQVPKCTTAFKFEHAHGHVKYEAAGFVSSNRRPQRIELFELVKSHQQLFDLETCPQLFACCEQNPVRMSIHAKSRGCVYKADNCGE